MSNKVLVTGSSVSSHFLQKLRDAGYEVDNAPDLLTDDELIKRLNGVSGLLAGGDEFIGSKILEAAPDLKVIAALAMSYRTYVDVEAAIANNVVVTYTPGTLTKSVTELTIGHLLGIARMITAANNYIKHGLPVEIRKMHELSGKRVGIVGLGAVGTETARKLSRGFDMEVVYYSRTRKPDIEKELGITYLELDELLSTSDFVVLLVSDNASSRNMIGKRELELMRQSAFLINIARPTIVDPKALSEVLHSKKIAGVSMDGYYIEPYPKPQDDPHKLLTLPDDVFIVTAHMGSLTHEARDAMAEANCNSIINIIAGHEDPNLIPECRDLI
ncbi:MAG TPA: NAD(P)-dependent oxidoreductase [Candidatus Saccharimonadales bacterium]|jgi:lactate dehydrogenase-like 2-hydroxyacid dehydrogenase